MLRFTGKVGTTCTSANAVVMAPGGCTSCASCTTCTTCTCTW